MPTQEKVDTVAKAVSDLSGVNGLFLADFSGMSVEKLSLLRKKCREEDIRFKVLKNTLLRRAFHANGIQQLDEYLVGNTGLVYSKRDDVSPARVLVTFAKEHERPKVKAAVVNGRLYDDKAIAVLASLPSREVLLQQVLGTFIAPMTQFLAAVEAALRVPALMADALERERSKAS
ncbi:MAG: 50S ribosomal protein L10 [Candidatus Eisenbacteria bacterium]|uniref:Large ribosomal subunit protein uL10 n=1 Tax=Eiseniibacteriota bacterium TaxID=2212470 RepID=A0A849SQX7_UNCEI|nr:50S ribosomal protein L10 [Candidatus Eisenbacteria bacterium]